MHSQVNNLFVYGTLRPGESNYSQVAAIEGTWQPASISGYLFRAGQGGYQPYPGLLLPTTDNNELLHRIEDNRIALPNLQQITGSLLMAIDLKPFLTRLDAFEGDGYKRSVVTANFGASYADNQVMQAYVYQATPAFFGLS